MSRQSRISLTAAMYALAVMLLVGCGSRQEAKTGAKPAQASGSAKDSLAISLVGRDSVSVFDLLKESHKVETVPSALGVFVKGIDSIANSSHASWVYSVNDSMPQIASDKCLTKTGDRVVWHYRKAE